MATLREIVYDILSTARGGRPTDDELIEERQIIFWINKWRANFVHQMLAQSSIILPERAFWQDYCVPLREEKISPCPEGLTAKGGTIPAVLGHPLSGRLLLIAMPAMGSARLPVLPLEHLPVWRFRQLSGVMPAVFATKDKVIVLDNAYSDLCYLWVRAVFEDPTAVQKCQLTDGQLQCEPFCLDDEYPVPEWLVGPLTIAVLSREMAVAVSAQYDILNDSSLTPQTLANLSSQIEEENERQARRRKRQ